MILLYAKKWSEDFLFEWVDKIGLAVSSLALVSLVWVWVAHFREVSKDRERMEESVAPLLVQSFPGEMIGQGPLRLRSVHASRWVARIAEELTLLAYNSRPDLKSDEMQVILQLKAGRQQVAIPNGSVLFLEEQEGKGLALAEGTSALWIKPIVLDETSAMLEVGRQLANGTLEKGEFITSFQGMGKKLIDRGMESISAFRSATAFMQDLIVQRYGGAEFANWNQKVVLDLQGKEGPYGLRISSGDHLMYEEGEWRVASIEELQSGKQVAKVLSVSEKGVDIEIWDDQGFSPLRLKVDVQKAQKSSFGPESVPSLARFRTPTQVSCVFGKRRMIVRSGDWLVRGGSGWRHLRSAQDLQLYLDRRVKGDLFVCESIERDALGKGMMKGFLFDETHTMMQPVQVPVSSDKPSQKSSRNRRVNRGAQ